MISLNRLTPAVQDLIHEGGPQGPPGGPGAPGAPGAPGGSAGPTLSSGNFGVENRNTTGSPVAQLRSGPNGPPLGTGSLNLLVAKGEKIAYGITISGSVSNLKEVGYRVNTTGENTSGGAGSVNMPSIAVEIDPNISSLPNTNYSTLVWTPAANSASQQMEPLPRRDDERALGPDRICVQQSGHAGQLRHQRATLHARAGAGVPQ